MSLSVFAVALLYGALELATLLLFLRPYARQGLARRCETPRRRALRALFPAHEQKRWLPMTLMTGLE